MIEEKGRKCSNELNELHWCTKFAMICNDSDEPLCGSEVRTISEQSEDERKIEMNVVRESPRYS